MNEEVSCDGLVIILKSLTNKEREAKREEEEEEAAKKKWNMRWQNIWTLIYESICLPSDISCIFSARMGNLKIVKKGDLKRIDGELPHSSDRCTRWAFCVCINERFVVVQGHSNKWAESMHMSKYLNDTLASCAINRGIVI